MTFRRWKITTTGDPDKLDRLLAEGWEPISMTVAVGYIYILRRRYWTLRP